MTVTDFLILTDEIYQYNNIVMRRDKKPDMYSLEYEKVQQERIKKTKYLMKTYLHPAREFITKDPSKYKEMLDLYSKMLTTLPELPNA